MKIKEIHVVIKQIDGSILDFGVKEIATFRISGGITQVSGVKKGVEMTVSVPNEMAMIFSEDEFQRLVRDSLDT